MLPPAIVLAAAVALPPPDRPPALPATTVLHALPRRNVPMYARPGGRAIARAAPRTLYGRPLVLSVTRRQGPWGAVHTPLVPNGHRVWVRLDRGLFAMRRTRWRLSADLSRRTLRVLRGTRVVRTIRVSIGSSALPTPEGAFAITDKLDGRRFGAPYGCCILALSGHQPMLHTARTDARLAIHGTNRPDLIGDPVSEGCLRAADRQLRWLMQTVPVGTPVKIHG